MDAFAVSVAAGVGLWLGRRLGARFGRRAEVAGGLVPAGVGAGILISHLAAQECT